MKDGRIMVNNEFNENNVYMYNVDSAKEEEVLTKKKKQIMKREFWAYNLTGTFCTSIVY